ncbi:MAG: (d)CMP kinase [Desulfobacterales bacterium]|nr:(d)CMP kinase [Desulfobacterales bacterium]
MKKIIIVIDGPAGAGKTTVGRMLADCLGYRYIDTGALYRGVAFEAKAAELRIDDDSALENFCKTLKFEFVRDKRGVRILSGGLDITEKIRHPEITMLASKVSARPIVRKFLFGLQREMGLKKGVVLDGRDMGTVVFPDADIKFFLDASAEIRTHRRYNDLKSICYQTLDEIERDIKQRDKNDSSRDIAPLKPAPDAIIIDSTNFSAKEVVHLMLSYIKEVL